MKPNPRDSRPHLSKDESRYYGKNACLAIWQHRPKDIIRVYVKRELSEDFADLLGFCAKNRKSYHLVGDGDLERLADSVHHQGICVVAKTRRPLREQDFFRELSGSRKLVLYLDGVGNPHNLGAILRTAAHFGVEYVAYPKESLPRLPPAAHRTSEGAAEFVALVSVENIETFFDRLEKQGFRSYAFEFKPGAQSMFETRFHERSIFLFGAEVEGLSGLARACSNTTVMIPGTGNMESLNVSVAAALATAEFQRQGLHGTTRIVKKPS